MILNLTIGQQQVTANIVINPAYISTGGGGSWGSITGTLANQTDLSTALNNKVDKVTGKGLSTEDYTTTEKNKLSALSVVPDVTVIQIPFSVTVDLSEPNLYSQQQLSGATVFSPITQLGILGSGYCHTVAVDLNGITPTFSGFTLYDENSVPDETAGNINILMFFKLGTQYYYNWVSSYTGVLDDTTPPTLSAVTISAITQITAQINATSNEAATFYWTALDNGATAPNYADIIAGTSAIDYGTISLSAGVSGNDAIASLVYLTAYDVYYFAEDASANRSTVTLIEFTTIDRVQLTAPVITVASAGQTQLNISVNANLNGVELYIATTENGTYSIYETLTAGDLTAAPLTGLTQGTTRYFKGIALGDDTTSTDSALSIAYSGTTSSIIQLSTPGSFSATSASQTQINLSWTDVSNESSYLIEVSDTGTSGWTTLTSPVANATSASHTGLTLNTTKYYRISAIGDGTNYSNSGYATANATTSGLTQLSAPTAGAVTVVSSTALTPNVSGVDANATYLKLEYKLTSSGTWLTHSATLPRTTLSVTITGLANNSSYDFRWTAIGNGTTYSDSNSSSTATGSTLANAAPTYSTVTLTGTMQEGQTISGTQSGYSDADGDAEGTPTIKYYKADTVGGVKTLVATASTYVLQSTDVDKYMYRGVTPVAATGTSPGTEVFSAASGQVTAVTSSTLAIESISGLNSLFVSELNSDFQLSGTNILRWNSRVNGSYIQNQSALYRNFDLANKKISDSTVANYTPYLNNGQISFGTGDFTIVIYEKAYNSGPSAARNIVSNAATQGISLAIFGTLYIWSEESTYASIPHQVVINEIRKHVITRTGATITWEINGVNKPVTNVSITSSNTFGLYNLGSDREGEYYAIARFTKILNTTEKNTVLNTLNSVLSL